MRLRLLFLALACTSAGVACRPSATNGRGDGGISASGDGGDDRSEGRDADTSEDGGFVNCFSKPGPTESELRRSLGEVPSEIWHVDIAAGRFVPGISWRGGELFLSVGNRLIAVRDGQISWQRYSPDGDSFSGPTLLEDGSIAVAGNDLVLFSSAGTPRWRRALGTSLGGKYPPVLVGEHLIVATSSREIIGYSKEGTEQWRRSVEGRYGGPPVILGAFSNYIVLLTDSGNAIYEVESGTLVAQPAALQGGNIGFRAVAADVGLVFSRTEATTSHYGTANTEVFDFCGNRTWSLPTNNETLLIGLNEMLVTKSIDTSGEHPQIRNSFWRRDGSAAGTVSNGGVPLAFGADGTVYLARCTASGTSELAAIDSASATENWHLPISPGCPTFDATLDDSGVLAIVVPTAAGLTIIGYQTPSPGTGGAWPIRRRDNNGTNWLP